jgi:hypothetical protein
MDECKYSDMTDCPFYARCSEGKPCMYNYWAEEAFHAYALAHDRGE